jgi:hypothetical protein
MKRVIFNKEQGGGGNQVNETGLSLRNNGGGGGAVVSGHLLKSLNSVFLLFATNYFIQEATSIFMLPHITSNRFTLLYLTAKKAQNQNGN